MADDVTKKDLQALEKKFNKQIADITKKFDDADGDRHREILDNLANMIDIVQKLRQSDKDLEHRIGAIEQLSRS